MAARAFDSIERLAGRFHPGSSLGVVEQSVTVFHRAGDSSDDAGLPRAVLGLAIAAIARRAILGRPEPPIHFSGGHRLHCYLGRLHEFGDLGGLRKPLDGFEPDFAELWHDRDCRAVAAASVESGGLKR